MSYQVLARKYRPRSFDTLVGQEHVVRALTHALDQQRLHHAYLFTGTRGVGKTTLSRILAKSFNCETGITARPCGICEACTAIDAGRFVDYIEMDAASNRGVDEMAQLLEQAIYAPSNARFKVYMIDEVHMLTNHAFNAMLKTLEEPPEHVKFILATTDPQKIPVTVLSRCLQFNLKQMPPGHIVGHLENILGQEQIAFELPALRLLAQGAHGSMRDALSLTDQAIAYAAGEVTLSSVQGMLGALDQSYLIRVLDALAAQDAESLIAVADEMAARSLAYSGALQDLGSLLHKVALAQVAPAAVAEDAPERADIMRLAEKFAPEEIQLFYQIAVHGRNELGLAPDEYAGFSMTLLRMLAFKPADATAISAPQQTRKMDVPAQRAPMAEHGVAASVQTPASVPAREATRPQASIASPTAPSARPMSPARAALEAARSGKPMPSMPPRAAPLEQSTVQAIAQPAAQPAPQQAVPPWMDDVPAADESGTAESLAQKKTEEFPVSAAPAADVLTAESILALSQHSETAASPATNATAASNVVDFEPPTPAREIKPVPALNWDGDWPALAAVLPLRGVVQQLAQQSELLDCDEDGGVMVLSLRIPLETLRSAGSIEKLTQALTDHFDRPFRVNTVIGRVKHTANAAAVAAREARQREAEQAMHADPFVQILMRDFGATFLPDSIRPV